MQPKHGLRFRVRVAADIIRNLARLPQAFEILSCGGC